MRKILFYFFLIFCLIIFTTCQENPIDHYDPNFGKILFEIQSQSEGDSLHFICKLTKIVLNGESQYQILTPKNSFERDACWSPDGKQIAYVDDKDCGIFVMNSDGSGRKKIFGDTSTIVDLSWSPDGSKIVYSKRTKGTNSWYSLFIYDLTLQKEKPVNVNLPESGYHALCPTWSPDASKIAFVYFKHGISKIYSTDLKSGDVKLIYTSNDESITSLEWSPDGESIAFSVSKFLFSPRANVVGGIQIISADGQNIKQLTSSEHLDVYPSWSPDGTKIVFCRYVEGLLGSTLFTINLLDISKSSVYEILSSNKYFFVKTQWSRSK